MERLMTPTIGENRFSLGNYFRYYLYLALLVVNVCSENAQANPKKAERFLTYSADNPNILIILLDEYQKEFFETILDDELKKQLQGFIWFSDTVSHFRLTPDSILTIFTGDISADIERDKRYTLLSDKSIAKLFKKEIGGQVDIVGLSNTIIYKLFPQTQFDPDIWPYKNLLGLSVLRAVPDILKLRIYKHTKKILYPIENLTHFNSYRIDGIISKEYTWLQPLVEEKPLLKKDHPATFKYIHFTLTHSPTRYDENCNFIGEVLPILKSRANQGKCAIRIVIDIINNLKDVDTFDNTMILVMSDHGSFFIPEAFKRHKSRYSYSLSSSTLLIKPLKRTKKFTIDDYQAQLSDIPKTIAQAVKLPNDYPGVNLLSSKRVKNRIRFYHRTYGKKHIVHKIHGASNDPNNWRK